MPPSVRSVTVARGRPEPKLHSGSPLLVLRQIAGELNGQRQVPTVKDRRRIPEHDSRGERNVEGLLLRGFEPEPRTDQPREQIVALTSFELSRLRPWPVHAYSRPTLS